MKEVFISIGIIVSILIVLVFRPIIPCETFSEKVSGEITHLYDSGNKDISFKIKGNKTKFYINRGQEKNLNVDSLKTKLLHQTIDLYYAKHWTPLDPKNRIKHITRIEHKGEILFTEW